MKTITLFTGKYPPFITDGVGNTSRIMTDYFKENKDYKLNVVTVKYDPYSNLPYHEKIGNVDVYRLKINGLINKIYKGPLCSFYKLPQFTLFNKKIMEKTDVCHAMHFRDVPFILKHKKPLIVNVSDYYAAIVPLNPFKYPYDEKGRVPKYLNHQFMKILDYVSLKHSDLICTNSEYTRNTINRAYNLNPEKSRVVYKGVEIKEFEIECERDIDIAFIGSRFETKGAKELILAISKIKKRFPNLKCVMMGSYSKIDLDYPKMISDLGLKNNIQIVGPTPNNQVIQYLKRSKIYVLPTYVEAFPQTVLEAMAAKLPVIATNVGGIPESVTQKTGFFIKPKEHEELAEKLDYLLSNPSIAKEMGDAGYERVCNYFTAEIMIKKYLAAYEKFI